MVLPNSTSDVDVGASVGAGVDVGVDVGAGAGVDDDIDAGAAFILICILCLFSINNNYHVSFLNEFSH